MIPSSDIDVWHAQVVLAALAEKARERESLAEMTGVLDDPSLLRFGPASEKTPFSFQDWSYAPDSIQPSAEVMARWKEYLQRHPEHGPSLPTQPLPSACLSGEQPVPTHIPISGEQARKRKRSGGSGAQRRKRKRLARDSSPPSSPLSPTSPLPPSSPLPPNSPSPSSSPLLPTSPSPLPPSSPPLPTCMSPLPPSSPLPLPSSSSSSSPLSASSPLPSSPMSGESIPSSSKLRKRGKQSHENKRRRQNAKWRASHGNIKLSSDRLPPPLAAKHLKRVQATKAAQMAHKELLTNKSAYIGPPPVSKPKVDYLQNHQWPHLPKDVVDELPPSVQKYVDEGFHILENKPDMAQVITDLNDVILVVKALPPKSPMWQFIVESVEAQLAKLDAALTYHAYAKEPGTTRTTGLFKHITVGLSMGGGQQAPKYLNIRNDWHQPMREFMDHPDVRIFAEHMSKVFKFWFPKLYALYMQLVTDLHGHDPHAHGAFPGFPMHDETANTGKKTATPEHVDFKNAIFGVCVIAIFGTFNHRKSGLLVLRELKVLMQLAPGDIVFIPSALITHGNTDLAEEDIRRSWTLYTAGGLFRYRDAGFKTEKELEDSGQFEFLRSFRRMQASLLKERLGMHMTLEQLRQYYSS